MAEVMKYGSYKTALRAKGIRPIPSHGKLRSYRGEGHVITASEPARRNLDRPKRPLIEGRVEILVLENCTFEGIKAPDGVYTPLPGPEFDPVEPELEEMRYGAPIRCKIIPPEPLDA